MTLDEIKKYFISSYNFSKLTGMSHTNFVSWRRKNYVPILAQLRIESLTGGKLKSNYDHGENKKNMLTKTEIEKILSKPKKELIMPDPNILEKAEGWDLTSFRVSAGTLAIVYSYLKHRYKPGKTIYDLEKEIGFIKETISRSIRCLEYHGYVTISRSSKPYIYAVIL